MRVHLRGGGLDGRHVDAITTDWLIWIDRTGQPYRRTGRTDGEDGCGLPVFKLAPGLTSSGYYRGRWPSAPIDVHLRGGPHDGSHVQAATGDQWLIIDLDGARYRRILRREHRHGCGLVVFKAVGRRRQWLTDVILRRGSRGHPPF